MKTITFTYTKKDKSVSERTLLVMVSPGDKYAGIDLSELGPAEGANFVKAAEELHNKYLADLRVLQGLHDLKFAYKQFFEEGMSDVIEI